MKKLIAILFLLPIFVHAQTTEDGTLTVGSTTWRYRATLPPNYAALAATNTFPGIFYVTALGETKADTSLIAVWGPHKFIRNGGKIFKRLASGDTLWPVVITIQPTNTFPVESFQKSFYDQLISRYHLRKGTALYGVGYSHGGWCFKTFVTGDPLGGSTYASYFTGLADILGMKPADNSPYPTLFDNYANVGGRIYFAEQLQDGRDQITQANEMNKIVPGSAIYRKYNFGDGGHTCCVDNWMGGSIAPVDTFLLDGKQQNIYSWLLGLGDTSLPVALNVGVANAGADQNIYMPQYTVTLSGSGGSTYQWTKISGGTHPTEGMIINPTSASTQVTRLAVGTYKYQLSIDGGASKDTVVVNVWPQKSPACNTAPKQSFTLTASGTQIFKSDATTIGAKGGDTIHIPAGTYSLIQLGSSTDTSKGLMGDSCNHIQIVLDGPVYLQYTGVAPYNASPTLRFYSCRYFDVRGGYNLHFSGVEGGIGYTVSGASSNYLIEKFDVNGLSNAALCKNNPDSTKPWSYDENFFFRNVTVQYFNVKNTAGEGFYYGWTGTPIHGSYRATQYDNLTFQYGRVDSAGWDGIQTSGARNTLIQYDTVNVTGLANNTSQQYGIILGGWGWGTVQHCKVYGAGSAGIALFSNGHSVVNDVTIDSCAQGGIDGAFTSIYCNDNILGGVANLPFSPSYSISNVCIRKPSGYTNGAAIRSNDGHGTTVPGSITNVTIDDPLGRSLSNLIQSNVTGDVLLGNVLGSCTPPVPIIKWKFQKGSKIRLRSF